jgi:hypothetical protein
MMNGFVLFEFAADHLLHDGTMLGLHVTIFAGQKPVSVPVYATSALSRIGALFRAKHLFVNKTATLPFFARQRFLALPAFK